MATSYDIDINVDSKKAVAGLTKLEKEVKVAATETERLQTKLDKLSKKSAGMDKKSKEFKALNKEIKKTGKELDKTKKSTEKSTASMSAFGGAAGGVGAKLTILKTGLKSVSLGFKTLRGAIMMSGIGALVLGIMAVVQSFKSSEEGQNKFAKIMAVIGSVIGNVTDVLADLGSGIIYTFTHPIDAIKSFAKAIKTNITNRITSLIDTFGYLGEAIGKVFEGDFSGAMDTAAKAGSTFVDSLTGVKNTIDKVTGAVKELSDELIREAKIAASIADNRAKADKLERKLIVERAKANKERADLLNKAVDKENFTAKQRIEFLKEAGKIEEDITNKEIRAAKIRLKAKQQENSLSKSTKEDLDAVAQLQARLIDLETAKLRKAKLVTTQIVAVNNEIKASAQAITDAEKKKHDTLITGLETFIIKQKKLVTDASNKAKEGYLFKFEEAKRAEEARYIDSNEQLKLALDKKLLTTEEYDAKVLANDNLNRETLANNAKAAAVETKNLEDKLLKEKKENNEEERADNLKVVTHRAQLAGDVFAVLGQLSTSFAAKNEADAKKQFEVNKAFSLASAITNTGLAVTAALTAGGNPVKLATGAQFVEAGIAGVVGVANIAKIAGTQFKSTDKGTPSIPSTPTLSTPSNIDTSAPTTNFIGQGGETGGGAVNNAGSNQSPIIIQNNIVESDITDAQSNVANIVEFASFGLPG